MTPLRRREFLRQAGLSAAVLPFIVGLPSLALAAPARPRQRLVVVFSPNGTIPNAFWPDAAGRDFALKEILAPLAPFKDRMLTLQGVSNKVRGDGDGHMRGMSCLLTGIELLPGNIQGGGKSIPAGWASGISIDQEIKNFFQSRPETRTRFGSLEFGVGVQDRADPWTRMSYAGSGQPVAPISDPYQMHGKLYGQLRDRESLRSVLDPLKAELAKVRTIISREDRRMLEAHETLVRQLEREIAENESALRARPPALEPGVADQNDNVPRLSRMQIDLLVNSFVNDMARVATLQYTKSVGGARMNWLDITDGHHGLSHEPDTDESAQSKLIKINTWFAGEVRYLAERLAATPEPGATGSMLDHTMIVWTNELGKGNSHTLDNIPFVLIGGGMGFDMGRALKFDKVAHNRLHLALAHGVGHRLPTFGKPSLCDGGPLALG
jgi:hypothetical protein